ncbi:MAG: hypothetical protein WKF66_13570 [Pedobacter sp.]
MKQLLEKIIFLLTELVLQQKLQLMPVTAPGHTERWIDQRNTMHMLMRTDRQLLRYVREGQLISRKIGRSPWYLESSILAFIEKSQEA